MPSVASDYNAANPSASTNVTVYPPPLPSPSSAPHASKKRKIDSNDVVNGDVTPTEATQAPGGAVYPQLVHTNEHIRMIQSRNKVEFEDMISLCVSRCPMSSPLPH